MSNHPSGPPYAPTTAAVGGVPSISVDVPISAVFMFLYILSAIGHMTIFQINKRRGQKFIMSGMMFGFSVARTVTMILVSLLVASNLLTQANHFQAYCLGSLSTRRPNRHRSPDFRFCRRAYPVHYQPHIRPEDYSRGSSKFWLAQSLVQHLQSPLRWSCRYASYGHNRNCSVLLHTQPQR